MAQFARAPLHQSDSSIFNLNLTPELEPICFSGAQALPSPVEAGSGQQPGPPAQRQAPSAPGPDSKIKRLEAFLSHRFALPVIFIVGVLWIASLGLLYRHKSNTRVVVEMPRDLRELHAKAEAGDVTAMRMLGIRYCYGVATPVNSQEGVKWLRRAASLGNVPAQKELAAMGARD